MVCTYSPLHSPSSSSSDIHFLVEFFKRYSLFLLGFSCNTCDPIDRISSFHRFYSALSHRIPFVQTTISMSVHWTPVSIAFKLRRKRDMKKLREKIDLTEAWFSIYWFMTMRWQRMERKYMKKRSRWIFVRSYFARLSKGFGHQQQQRWNHKTGRQTWKELVSHDVVNVSESSCDLI